MVLLALAWPAMAKRVALVIGNNAYQEVPVLQKAVNDAQSVTKSLQNLGFEVDLGENLTRRQINSKFASFVERIEPGDTTFFFFSGHGVAIGGQNILLPVDVPASDKADLVRDEGHVVDDLIQRIKDKGAGVSMFVLDACRNNPFTSKGGKSIGASRGLQVVSPPSGTFVLMAAGAGQEALDRLSDDDADPNSVFTRTLLPLLDTPGMTHIALAKAVQRGVEKTAKSIGHQQQPAFYDQISGEVVLLPLATEPLVATVETKPSDVVEVATKSTTDGTDPAMSEWNAIKDIRSTKILQAFIRKYPDSNYAEYARALVDDIETSAAQAEKASKASAAQAAEAEKQAAAEAQKQAEAQNQAEQTREVESAALDITPTQVAEGWFVILGSFPHGEVGRARQRVQRMANAGYSLDMIDTDDYDNLKDGYFSVVMGPYSRSEALRRCDRVRQYVSDAYIKEVH